MPQARKMTKTELRELIAQGQNSVVEFKSHPIDSFLFAREVVAFANQQGGRMLIGVDDDGRVSGLRADGATRKRHGDSRVHRELEERVAATCRDRIHPVLFPCFEVVRDIELGRDVAVVTVDRGWTAHHLCDEQQRSYCVRAGRTHREASAEELAVRFPQQGAFRLELRPVSGTSLANLDRRRLVDYFVRVREQKALGDGPSDARWGTQEADWETLLINTLMLREEAPHSVTVAALMLFGKNPSRFLPHAKIESTAYIGTQKDSEVKERRTLRGPIVPLRGTDGSLLELGLVEQAMDFVEQNAGAGRPAGGVRPEEREFPLEAVREAILNAVIHRDYQITAGIEISIYADHLEIVSPGRLANGSTVERMRAGCRRARNELLKDVMRDYGYMDHIGMGVPRKIVQAMKEHNGTEPDLVEEEDRFTVRLWRERS